MTTKEQIGEWFERGLTSEAGATHMIVAYDDWDAEDFPVFVKGVEALADKEAEIVRDGVLRIMEIYDLRLDKEMQLNEERAFHR